MATILDANYILRWFLNDVAEQAKRADTLINTAAPGSIILHLVSIAEVTYILRSMGYDHGQVYLLFQELQYYPSLQGLIKIDELALRLYRDSNLDFEDCVLIALHQVDGHAVATFDKALLRGIDKS